MQEKNLIKKKKCLISQYYNIDFFNDFIKFQLTYCIDIMLVKG